MYSGIDLIEIFLKSPTILKEEGPSDWHFEIMQNIVNTMEVDAIVSAIIANCKKYNYDKHQAAYMLSMLIWYSPNHDLAVSAYFENWEHSNDELIIGICISHNIEWYPFGNAIKTIEGIKSLRDRFPQFEADYTYWNKVSTEEIQFRQRQQKIT